MAIAALSSAVRLANLETRTLPYLHTKAGALDPQQVQQLAISIMERRPAHLRLYGLELPLQLISSHLTLRRWRPASEDTGPLATEFASIRTKVTRLAHPNESH